MTDDKMDALFKHYERVAKENQITTSVWAIFDIEDLNQPVPFKIKELVYTDHWGKSEVHVAAAQLNVKTWADMWKLCDVAINISRDFHHVFIEKLVEREDGVFVLTTGS